VSVKTAAIALGDRQAFFAHYKDPRWRRFSNEVREFYANVCSHCRASDKATQVHHWKYYPGRMPWEYDMGEVTLLCAGCHDQAHNSLQHFRKFVFPRLSPAAFRVLNGALAVGLSKYNQLELCYAIAELVSNPGSVKRFCDDWAKSSKKIVEFKE
jgi:hypothetical protein